MARHSKTYRIGQAIVGGLAAIALAIRGVLDLNQGSGAALILVSLAIVAAFALRYRVFRD